VQVNIKKLVDDVQCYQTVRALRWPDGVACPSCASKHVIKRGFDDTEPPGFLVVGYQKGQ
jgi:Transposase zinc-ribbon domain